MKKKLFPIGLLSAAFLALIPTQASGAVQSQTEADVDTTAIAGYNLDELVIEAERPVMQTDGAKLTYNVDEDPAAESSTALDILKKVPMVTVDGDGNVMLNGSGAFKFEMNGLENPMLKQYAGQILQAMPASSVVKIEVITEPGAKDDAEGTAGIINIITERTRSNDGYSGSISLQGSNRGLTPSLYGIAKKDKVTVSANVNYQWGYAAQKGEQNSTNTYLTPPEGNKLVSTAGQRSKHQFTSANLNMSWEPNSRNLFTAGAELFYIDANLYSIYGNTSSFDAYDNLLWKYSQTGKGNMNIKNISANVSYRHNFAPEGNFLVLSYLFNFGNTSLWINQNVTDRENYTPDYLNQHQASTTYNRGHTVQADYSNNFKSEHHLLETGVKGIFRRNTAFANYAYGNEPDKLEAIPGTDSDIMQPQNIYAAYASYTGTFGSFGMLAGVRYEHTLMGITDRTNPARTFRKHLNDWVPNAALTWSFSPASNLRLSYQMRISRPSIDQVNPFELSFTPYQIRQGNPDLTSERNHIVSLKYSSFGRVIGGSIGVEYNRADNAISSISYLEKRGDINALITSYANIGRDQDVALTGFFNWSIIRNMNLAVSGRIAYNMLRSPAEGYRNHGWSGNIGANWNYTVDGIYKFSAYGVWTSRSLSLQGSNTGYYYYGLSASRDFLPKKNLTLSISANNFLQSKMRYKSHTVAHDVIYDSDSYNLSAWSVSIGITWKFGNINTQVKKTGVDLNNDDINTSSNKGQGSSI